MMEEKEIGEKSRILRSGRGAGSLALSFPLCSPRAQLLNMHVSGSGGAQSNRRLFFFLQ